MNVPASYIVKLGNRKVSLKKIIYLEATESLICSRALMITQISAVNMDAESGNLRDIVSDGKTVAQATEMQFRDPSVKDTAVFLARGSLWAALLKGPPPTVGPLVFVPPPPRAALGTLFLFRFLHFILSPK